MINRNCRFHLQGLIFFFWLSCVIACTPGCKKSSDSSNTPETAATVVLLSTDMNADGTINKSGLQKIETESGASSLAVSFARTRLTDAGLNQLAKFRNLRRVQALGSPLSPEAIEKFKTAVPEVVIIK